MKKLIGLIVFGAGYVLGTKAGRERYEQIRRMFMKAKNDPRVQEKAHQAADLAREKAPVVKEKASEVADKIKGDSSGTADRLNPDSTALQSDPYPQGNLP
jgi:hypothetical protein